MSSVSNDDIGKQFKNNLVDASTGRFDSRMTTFADANYLQSEATLYPCMSVIATSTGFGFKKDRRRRRSADNDNWIEEDLTIHLHDANTDEAGGLLTNIEQHNLGNNLRVLRNIYNANNFIIQSSGTGAGVTNETSGSVGRIKIEAGTTSGGYADASEYGVPLSFSNDSAIMMLLEHNGLLTNYVMRAGINAEMINLSNSTTQQSYGIEACSASGSNVLIWSCKPPNRSTLISGYTHDALLHSWYLRHIIANAEIVLTRDIDFANSVSKTDDIPISGITQSKSLYGMGMKTTAASASKILRFYGAVIYAAYGDTLWKHYYQDILNSISSLTLVEEQD